MKHFFFSAFFICLFCAAMAQPKVVFILVDGVPADVLEAVETPVMDEIAAIGGYTRGYLGGEVGGASETPTVSAPGYMTLITGTWGNKHNVYDNAVKKPNYDYWNIFRIVKEADPKKKIAIFSTWEDNRTKLVGEGKPEAGNLMFDYSFDGFEKDEARFPHLPDRKFIFDIDELVSEEAARYLQQEGPDVSWVYLEFPDDIGHKFGDGPEMEDAVKKADVQVGRIWEAVKYRQKNLQEDWMLVVVTDHGRDPKTGKNHGKHSERERTIWILTNHGQLSERFGQRPAMVDVLPSMLQFLQITPPKHISAQFDGQSFLAD